MEYHLCDLCGVVLKNEKHILVLIPDTEITRKSNSLNQNRIVKEVCPSCLEVFRKIFDYKRKKVDKLKREILKMYEIGA